MSEDDFAEAERVKLLDERRKDWAEDNIDIDERFGPGSFGCHEVMHVTDILAGLVDGQLCNHSAILRDPRWLRLATEAATTLPVLSGDRGGSPGRLSLPNYSR